MPGADLAGPGAGDAGLEVGAFLQGDHRARLVQLVCHPGGPAFETLSHLRLESVVSVRGKVVARPPATVNPKLLTGEVEVEVGSCRRVVVSGRPPVPRRTRQ